MSCMSQMVYHNVSVLKCSSAVCTLPPKSTVYDLIVISLAFVFMLYIGQLVSSIDVIITQ